MARVFLSGKINDGQGGWRDRLFLVRDDGLSLWRWASETPDWDYPDWENDPNQGPWPVRSGGLRGGHDYLGPYRQGPRGGDDVARTDPVWRNTGRFHGTLGTGNHGCPDGWTDIVIRECRRTIAAADVVFAYVNTMDAYGTLAELGYAAGLGRFVALVVLRAPHESLEGHDDLWFSHGFADFLAFVDDEAGLPDVFDDAMAAYATARGWKGGHARHHNRGAVGVTWRFIER